MGPEDEVVFAWREPFKRFLLKTIAWLEQNKPHEKPPRSGSFLSFLRKDIHVPTYLVVFLIATALFIVLISSVGLSWAHAGSVLLLVGLVTGFCVYYVQRDLPEIARDADAVMLAGVIIVSFVWFMAAMKRLDFKVFEVPFTYGMPVASAGMLVTILLHPRLGTILTALHALILGMLCDFSFSHFFILFFSGVAGIATSLNVRHRSDIIRAGSWVALVHAAAVLLLHWFPKEIELSRYPDKLFGHLVLALLDGGLSAGLTLMFLPYLETFFSRSTPVRLLEMADFNQPLLKRLMVEAPGTYHHSLIVASLAEQAAEAIGTNSLLCRVGAYYHDVGKMLQPEYFVENQGSFGNVHDKLTPSMSRIVIMSHVKDGVALAKQYGVDEAIIDFIPMHHGTTCVEYFYNRAQEQETGETPEEEYRYTGPKPHSKETAIVMMADSVEATSRTLENPTHTRLKNLVDRIVQNKFNDGQFDECPLTMADLRVIKDSFVANLASIYHARIEYPERKSPHADDPAPHRKAP